MRGIFRALLMKGPLVLATRRRLKTETRRLNGLDKLNVAPDHYAFSHLMGPDDQGRLVAIFTNLAQLGQTPVPCPYGQPGDYLWIRESWAADMCWDDHSPSTIPFEQHSWIRIWYAADGPYPPEAGKSRTSIHMPKRACRTVVRIRELAVQRLADLTDAGDYFLTLWNRINPHVRSERNPWVWVVRYEYVEDQTVLEALWTGQPNFELKTPTP